MSEALRVGQFHFRFECQPGCTNCCTQNGYIYLTGDDIERIARHMEVTAREFEENFVLRSREGPRLNLAPSERCFFLTEGGCSIHAVKPLQCRVFPYWPENVGSRAAWSALRKYCPGVGMGPLVQIESVRAEAEAYQKAFPGQ